MGDGKGVVFAGVNGGEARGRWRRAGHGMPCPYPRCGLLGWVRVEANPCGAAPPVFALCPWWRFPYRAGGGGRHAPARLSHAALSSDSATELIAGIGYTQCYVPVP